MRKTISYCIFCLILLICACAVLFNSKKTETTLKTVKVSEVAHTIFYAPMYVAIENGYFEDVGLDVDLILSNGVNKINFIILFFCNNSFMSIWYDNPMASI